ncbi:hypothetical protein ACLOJK_003696 [Asimina triloba]
MSSNEESISFSFSLNLFFLSADQLRILPLLPAPYSPSTSIDLPSPLRHFFISMPGDEESIFISFFLNLFFFPANQCRILPLLLAPCQVSILVDDYPSPWTSSPCDGPRPPPSRCS